MEASTIIIIVVCLFFAVVIIFKFMGWVIESPIRRANKKVTDKWKREREYPFETDIPREMCHYFCDTLNDLDRKGWHTHTISHCYEKPEENRLDDYTGAIHRELIATEELSGHEDVRMHIMHDEVLFFIPGLDKLRELTDTRYKNILHNYHSSITGLKDNIIIRQAIGMEIKPLPF